MDNQELKAAREVKLRELLATCIDSTFHGKNRYNHGFANGVVHTFDVLFDENHPEIEVASYAEELASDANLGYEAIKLIERFLFTGDDDYEKRNHVIESMQKLLQAWQMNSWTKANMPAVDLKAGAGMLTFADGRGVAFKSRSDLIMTREVELAMRDSRGLHFRRLGTHTTENRTWLYAEYINPTGEHQSHERIGELSGDFKSLNLPMLEMV